ncbi:MAG: SpoIVB peptidase [Clostridia bacterium]|nr:SpoIVB peptidase [Clostridia bacterium]
MAKRVRLLVFLGIFTLSLLIICLNMQFLKVYTLPENLPISYTDVENINENKPFGKNITAHIEEKTISVGGEKQTIKTLIFKLFGFLPIKSIETNIGDEKEIFVGGMPIGFSIDVDGLIILGGNSVLSSDGLVNNFENSGLKKGDILTAINDTKVSSLEDLKKILDAESYKGEKITLHITRNSENIEFGIEPILDKEENRYKLGVWVRNDAAGVGTLTYVRCDNLQYGALGHPITDYETGTLIPARGGKIFTCSVVGLNKGEKGTPGEIKGVFMQGKNNKGVIEKNTPFGVFGTITEKDKIIDTNKIAEVGSRLIMKPGKATLISGISGVNEEYEIEIIKANYQPTSSDKSFVFRVTDKRLLDLTGGIIQGMSGSPILQNGKIVGAVTHVFVSDPTKGYGIYVDWMIAG